MLGGDAKVGDEPSRLIAPAADVDRLVDASAEAVLRVQKRSLEMLVRGAPLNEVLDDLARAVEACAPSRMMAALVTLDANGYLKVRAAPSLPDAYAATIDGMKASSSVGAISAATATGQAVLTPDVTSDPHWASIRSVAVSMEIMAAWGQPILARDGRVLGAFGAYFPERRLPTPVERRLVESLAHTAALAIERDQDEAHRQLMVNELNHRVKNTLATVQSIISQTLRTATDLKSAREAIDARLISLARAHDLLTAQSWSGADFDEVVRRTIEPFAPVRFDLDGSAVHVSPRHALALSMAIHELATNAAKYGSLLAPGGRVAVRWRVRDQALTLTWRETGGPPVSPPTRSGFGSRLLGRGLTAELGGGARLDFDPAGLICEIVAPL